MTITDPLANDPVNHPKHYSGVRAEIECIDITRHLPFDLGNAVKYVWRVGRKDPAAKIEDIEKALWYLRDYCKHCAFTFTSYPTAMAVFRLLPEESTKDECGDTRWEIIEAIVENQLVNAEAKLDAWVQHAKTKGA